MHCHRIEGSTQLYGVIGWPLTQSLSPLLHNTAFADLGLPALYQRWEVPPERLPLFVDSVRLLRIQGCSVTIPHKTPILTLIDAVRPLAKRAGAVNTLFWQDGQLCGENTDIAGFLAPLEQECLAGEAALVLGAGGASRAVALGLTSLPEARRPATVYVTTPSDKRHLPLAEEFGLVPLPWKERHEPRVRLVINATPLGMHGATEAETPYDFTLCPAPPEGLAYDIVYNPLETRFLRQARQTGRRCIGGLEMFYGQANAQFRLWTGRSLPEAARQALENALSS